MFTITTLEARTRGGLAPSLVFGTPGTPGTAGLYADVELADGGRLELSRLAGETAWIVDARWGKGSFPVFSNGYGARFCALVAAGPELAEALDAEAAR